MTHVRERLLSKIIEDKSRGCWIWTASLNGGGYARLGVDGHIRVAHRVSYECFRCEIPDGMYLDHLCRDRRCINPYHLEPVTHSVNCIRGNIGANSPLAQKQKAKTHCPKGHEYTDENTYINKNGARVCKKCSAISYRNKVAKNPDYIKLCRARRRKK